MAKSKVAVLKVKPETILSDIERLCDLAGMNFRKVRLRRDPNCAVCAKVNAKPNEEP